jgi:hypothetical protein
MGWPIFMAAACLVALADNPDRYSRILAFLIINFRETVATDTECLPI